MLGKLYKHDFKAMARVQVPLLLALVALTILGAIAARLEGLRQASASSGLLNFVFGMLGLFAFMAVWAFLVVSAVLIFQHYYKTVLSDEGYLTHTLPMGPGQILGAKLLSAFTWFVLQMLALILCLTLFLVFGFSNYFEMVFSGELFHAFVHSFRELSRVWNGWHTVIFTEALLLILSAGVNSILLIYLCLTAGGIVAHKHKVLSAIGLFFVISIIVNIVSSLVTAGFVETHLWDAMMRGSGLSSAASMLLVLLLWITALDVVYFLVNRHLLKNRLNLA